MKRNILIASILILGFAGCSMKDNPYDGATPQLSNDNPRKPDKSKTGNRIFSLDVPDVMEFMEGVEGDWLVQAAVPSPGKAKLLFSNMPDGMYFDEVTSRIRWNPSYDIVRGPGKIERLMKIDVTLTSSDDKVTALNREISIVVKNSPREFRLVKLTTETTFKEGQQGSQSFEIKNTDFPEGPFNIFIAGFPVGAQIVFDPKDNKKFILNYKPGYDFVNSSNADRTFRGLEKDIIGSLNVIDPNGRESRISLKWIIQNVVLVPVFSKPIVHIADSQVSITFLAQDQNQNENPVLELQNNIPRDQHTFSSTPAQEPFVSVGSFIWNNIPAEKYGVEQTFTFSACLRQGSFLSGNCSRQSVKVTVPRPVVITPPDPVPPAIQETPTEVAE